MKYLFTLLSLMLVSQVGFTQKKKEIVYVGTYSTRGSEGIYVLEFDRAKGKFKKIQAVKAPDSPTFLAIHPSGKFLYAVSRGSIDEMKNSGSISSYNIDPKTGKLTLLNQRPSYGSEPCHISFDKTGKWIFVSNYTEGNFVVLPIFDDGLVGSSSDSRKHTGHSVNADRQQKAYVHSAFVSPDNRYILVSDLGADEIHSYQFDDKTGRINSAGSSVMHTTPGAGPRHLTFHPTGKYVYSAEELTSTVGAYNYDAASGKLTVMKDSIISLPKEFDGKNTSADIHTDPKGDFLYVSNRGLDAISIFTIGSTGNLKLIGEQSTQGRNPRNFYIEPKGDYVFAANQDGDNVVVLKRDQKTGLLKYTGQQIKIPSPVCVKMLTLK